MWHKSSINLGRATHSTVSDLNLPHDLESAIVQRSCVKKKVYIPSRNSTRSSVLQLLASASLFDKYDKIETEGASTSVLIIWEWVLS